MQNEKPVLVSQPIDIETSHLDDSQRRRARTLPGSANSRRASVELLIKHFESVSLEIR